MSKGTAYTWPQLGGLSTTGNEDGLEQPRFVQFQDMRVSEGMAKRRKGMARLLIAQAQFDQAADFNGSSQYITIPLVAGIHTLRRLWTFEALVKADSFATNAKTVFGVAHAADYSLLVYFTTAGNLIAKIQDSAGTVTTLTSASAFSTATKYALQVVRDGTSLTMRVNGASEATGTMADLDGKAPGGDLYIARDNGGLYFDGIIDYVRIEQVAKPDQRYGLYRHWAPRNGSVLLDYIADAEQTTRCNDRSRNENHATITGSPTLAAGNILSVQGTPINGLASWYGDDGKVRLFVGAGQGAFFPEQVK